VARPELPIGTWGKIRTEKLGPERFCARARFRDYDGTTRDIEATDTTGPAAIRSLKIKLRDRTTPNDDEITRETRLNQLAESWIDEITAEERLRPQTIHRYQTSLRTAILPALGNLRIREASVGRLDKFLRGIAKDHPSAAKGAKVVLGQMFALAVRHGAIPTNPVRDTGRLRKPRRKVVALTDEHLQAVRAAIRNWQQPVPGKPGPRHTGDLADIVDLMLATGARIGEILALRWEDLDLAAAGPTLTICGTLVQVKGKGVFRQEWTKSDAGYRMIVLPRFAVGMLLARKLVAADNPYDARGAERGCHRTTSAGSGAKPAPKPASSGSPRTPSARPSPPSSTRRPTPRARRPSLATPANRSPTRITSPSPSSHPMSQKSSNSLALTEDQTATRKALPARNGRRRYPPNGRTT
jgi:integrase